MVIYPGKTREIRYAKRDCTRPEGVVHYEMKVLRYEVEHLLILEPQCRLPVDCSWGRIKHDQVATVFQCSNVRIHR